MKLKRIVIFLMGLLVITVMSIVVICYFVNDSRLSGTYKSNKDETIREIESVANLPSYKIYILKQIYGKLTLIFKGHRMKWVMEPHVINNYPTNGKTTYDNGGVKEAYFFLRANDNKGIIYVIPKQFWNVKDVETISVEFVSDGFWLNSSGFGLGVKEKFTNISINRGQ